MSAAILFALNSQSKSNAEKIWAESYLTSSTVISSGVGERKVGHERTSKWTTKRCGTGGTGCIADCSDSGCPWLFYSVSHWPMGWQYAVEGSTQRQTTHRSTKSVVKGNTQEKLTWCGHWGRRVRMELLLGSARQLLLDCSSNHRKAKTGVHLL